MKYTHKISLLIGSILLLFSCIKEEDKLQVAATEFGNVILSPTTGETYVLNPLEEQTNTAITFSWNKANYTTQTAINYTVEFATAGSNFATPIPVVENTNSKEFSMNIAAFNTAALTTGLTPFLQGAIEVRIKSSLGAGNAKAQYSSPITINVTPFTTDLPTIAVPGNHQGWNPETAPLLASSAYGETDYEGYVWLDGEYKFLAPNDKGVFKWGNTDWGEDGTTAGKLKIGGANCTIPKGYYLVKADTEKLTYTTTKYHWGLIGSATPDEWNSDQDMTYDPASKTWKITLNLIVGEIKFRANDSWGWNYGDNGNDKTLENGGDNIALKEAGNYTVTLDLSKPREYTYSLIKN